MSTPVKVAKMTPAADQQGVPVYVDVMYLDDIPQAMDNMGWKVSAQLMRRWFATKPAWAMPANWRGGKYPKDSTHSESRTIDYSALPSSQIDDQIVKMKWAMGFDSMQAVLPSLRRSWNSSAAINELKIKLIRSGWKAGQNHRLGRDNLVAKELDYVCQVNRADVGSTFDVMDDFFGALNKATLKVAVVGQAFRSWTSKRDYFEVERVGFYLRDTYDFNVSWYEDAFMGLGIWSKQRCLSKAEMLTYKATPLPLLSATFPGFVPAKNTDFRRWQQQRNEGGDFFVFSDVLWETYHGPAIEIPSL